MKTFGVLPFAELAPDQPDFAPIPHMEIAANCIARAGGYTPLPELEPITTALPDRPIGADSFRDDNGNSYTYVGTSSKIYQLVQGGWTDVSKPGGYPFTKRWEFVKWGARNFAASLSSTIQTTGFGAPNYGDLVPDIKAATMAVVRGNQVLVGNVEDFDGLSGTRMRWCAVGNPDDWLPSQSTLAGFAELESTQGGKIIRCIGGEYATVFQERSIWRGTFLGSPNQAYQWDEFETGSRVFTPGGIVELTGQIYYLAEDGFRVTRGGPSTAIGEEKIDITVLSDLDQGFEDRITAVSYDQEQVIIWAYPGAGNVNGRPNKLAIYNVGAHKWTTGDEAIDLLLQARAPATSIDDLDQFYGSIDDVPGSLDDNVWSGGGLNTAAFLASGELAFFGGPSRTATFETNEVQHTPGARTQINEVRPAMEGLNSTLQIGYRNNQGESTTFTQEVSPNAQGVYETRVNSRYIRYRVRLSAPWVTAVGVEPFGVATGGR